MGVENLSIMVGGAKACPIDRSHVLDLYIQHYYLTRRDKKTRRRGRENKNENKEIRYWHDEVIGERGAEGAIKGIKQQDSKERGSWGLSLINIFRRTWALCTSKENEAEKGGGSWKTGCTYCKLEGVRGAITFLGTDVQSQLWTYQSISTEAWEGAWQDTKKKWPGSTSFKSDRRIDDEMESHSWRVMVIRFISLFVTCTWCGFNLLAWWFIFLIVATAPPS